MRGKEMGTVRPRHASKPRLTSRFGEFIGTSKIDPQVVPPGLFENTRPYLETLVVQINGTYQAGFYDACAVMCRRLLQCMLLLAFERAANGEVIRDVFGEYRAFADVILAHWNDQHVCLMRTE